MLLQVEHLMQVGDVVDGQDRLDLAEGAERRVGHDRAEEPGPLVEIGRDGADLRGRQAYAACRTAFRSTEPAPSAKKPPNSV